MTVKSFITLGLEHMQRLCLDPDFSPDEAEEKARLISQVGLVQLLGPYSQHNQRNKLESYIHRDADACKNVSSFEIIMFAVYGPHSWFLTQSKGTVTLSNLVFFYNKSKILTIFFIVKYDKITLFDEFLVLLTTKGACSSPISMFIEPHS
jgi:hypothetical protein